MEVQQEQIRELREASARALTIAQLVMRWDLLSAYELAALLNAFYEACTDAGSVSELVGDRLRAQLDETNLPSAPMPLDAAAQLGVWAADESGRVVVTGPTQRLYRGLLLPRFEAVWPSDMVHDAA